MLPFALHFVPPASRPHVVAITGRIHVVLGRWLRGQLALIALVAGVVYLILGPLLHVPYAGALGVITGILEIIPLVGPLIAASLAQSARAGSLARGARRRRDLVDQVRPRKP